MNTRTYICPRDDYPLVPVFSVEGRKRRIIALSCPEPYCDHMQLVPRDRARELERFFRHESPQSANTTPALVGDHLDSNLDARTTEGPDEAGASRLVQ